MPFFIVLVNVLMSDVEFLKKDVAMIALVAFSYVVFNIVVSKLSGVPIYRFIHWNDLRSLITAFVFVLAACGVYMVLVMLTAILPRKEISAYV